MQKEIQSRFWRRGMAWAADAGTFGLLNLIQLRRWRDATRPDQLDAYHAAHGQKTIEEFYALPPDITAADDPVLPPADAPPRLDATGLPVAYPVSWRSPQPSAFPANDTARADFYPARVGWPQAPTVFFLHALMSASDLGYRMWAKAFHARGWNACFVQLPYHYRRKPPGYFNGELAVGCDALRVVEGIRQAVKELRQLRRAMQRAGAGEFGVWSTSYGGWIGALWSAVESGFRFLAFIQPIIDVDDVIWRSPAGVTLRRQLRARGVTQESAMLRALLPLATPMLHRPLDDLGRVLLLGGDYDQAVTTESLAALARSWAGSRFVRAPQGHMGYQLMRETFRQLETGGFLAAGG